MLTSQAVRDLAVKCANVGEDGDAVKVDGILNAYLFSKRRLEENREAIIELLMELPESFRENEGGGWSFLMAAHDKHGNHWGEHQNMEQLFCLGMGIGKVEMPLPREYWSALPGGMPYLVIKD